MDVGVGDPCAGGGASLWVEPLSWAMTAYTHRLIDYVVQSARFSVEEGFGCRTAPDFSILSALILQSWSVMAPLISISVYYRERIA